LHTYHSWEERHVFLSQVYDSNFMVGDIYETVALVTFGNVIMTVLETNLFKHVDEHIAVANAVRCHAPDADLEAFIRRVVCQLSISLKSTTVFGVKLFSYTCFVQGTYQLLVTTMGYYGFFDQLFGHDLKRLGFFESPRVKNAAAAAFTGAGIVASTAAITNIMMIERTYEHVLENFQPNLKFWCTKILVTLSCLQSAFLGVVPPFTSWSKTRVQLLYASTLTFECFLISIVNIYAWNPNQSWYTCEQRQDMLRVLKAESLQCWDGPGQGCNREDLFTRSMSERLPRTAEVQMVNLSRDSVEARG